MRRGRMRRLIAGAAGIAVLTGVALAPTPAVTEAAWVDAEYAEAGVQAITVPTPVLTQTPGCVTSSGLLGADPKITIYWRVPAGFDGYTSANAQFGAIITGGLLEPLLGGLLGNTTTTGNPGAYVTVVSGGLLTGLLGASKSFGIRLLGPGGWVSDILVAHSSMGLLGINPACTTEFLPS